MPKNSSTRSPLFPRAPFDSRPDRKGTPRKLAVEALECRQLLSATSAGTDASSPLPIESPAPASNVVQAFPLIAYASAADSSTSGVSTIAGPTATAAAISSSPKSVLPYLNDEDPNAPPPPAAGAPPIQSELFPRVTMTQDTSNSLQIESKYSTVAFDGARINTAATLKQNYPQTTVLRYFLPRSYESSQSSINNGMPFTGTGPTPPAQARYSPATWLYLAGTTTKQPISATTPDSASKMRS